MAQSCDAIARPACGYAPPLVRQARGQRAHRRATSAQQASTSMRPGVASRATSMAVMRDQCASPARLAARDAPQYSCNQRCSKGRPSRVNRHQASPNNSATIALDEASVARPARKSRAHARGGEGAAAHGGGRRPSSNFRFSFQSIQSVNQEIRYNMATMY
ncbi:hypothetical protein F511_46342 [Dorcoceras hygrometricum]|uniref:Uncharacterized protein n=1 Tax=Dorcoceras hygrometricum TaxID=472368 RepID=A0A2Z7A0S3_9LAMI|nr:hypothetical protein F511_46342 [Dorcoceras hygrometricum]